MDYKLPPPIGELVIIEVYAYIDGPKVFACESASGQKYLVNWIDTSETSDKWFYVPISDSRLRLVRSGDVSLRDSILKAEDGWMLEVITSTNQQENARVNIRESTHLSEDELPDVDSHLQPSLDSSELPSKEDTVLTAIRKSRDVLDFSLSTNGSHEHAIAADVLGNVLVNIQELTNAIALQKDFGARRRLPKNMLEDTQLKATTVFAASFGIRLESQRSKDLLGETPVSPSIEKLLNLIQSTENVKMFRQVLHDVNIRVIKSYFSLLKKLEDSAVEADIEWASPAQKYVKSRLSKEVIRRAINVIAEEVRKEVTLTTVTGELVGINVKRGMFHILADDKTISGRIDSPLRNHRFEVPVRIKATIEERTEINPASGEERQTYRLIEFESLD